jgi:hypothetical protein
MIYEVANLSKWLSLQSALEAGKWAWKENPEAPGQGGLKAKLGPNLKHKFRNFPRFKLVLSLVGKPQSP